MRRTSIDPPAGLYPDRASGGDEHYHHFGRDVCVRDHEISPMGPQVQTKAEIGELGLAVENFKSTYQVVRPRPRYTFPSNYAPPFPPPGPANADEANANRAVADSLAYLRESVAQGGMDRAAPVGPLPAGTQIALDGNQVLVFLWAVFRHRTVNCRRPGVEIDLGFTIQRLIHSTS